MSPCRHVVIFLLIANVALFFAVLLLVVYFSSVFMCSVSRVRWSCAAALAWPHVHGTRRAGCLLVALASMSFAPLCIAGAAAGAALVCTASGQRFGCVSDLLVYHTLHQGCSAAVQRKIGRVIVHPVDSLFAGLPRGCRLSCRPVSGLPRVVGYYLDGHYIGIQYAGRPYVCLLMSHRVVLRVDGTPPRFYRWHEGGLRECLEPT